MKRQVLLRSETIVATNDTKTLGDSSCSPANIALGVLQHAV